MRLRRLELAILGVTLAFAVFMGGYFTGRNFNPVNITQVSTERSGQQVEYQIQESPQYAESQTPNITDDSTGQNTARNTENNNPVNSQNTQVQGDGKININTASNAELTDLPGIGNTLAARIVDYRVRNGSFMKIEDIRNVTGIGERRFEAIKDMITVGN